MHKIVCFGEALIDLLALPPVAGRPPRFEQHAGGAPANVAVAVSRLGGDGAFIGSLASDVFGDFLLDELNSAGVDTRCVTRTDEARTALAFVTLDARGERRFAFYRPPAADLLFRIEDFPLRCCTDAAVFHVCSNSLTGEPAASATLEGLAQAAAAGALVSFDVNLRAALWDEGADPRERIFGAVARSDLVKLCRRELEFLAEPLGSEAALIARMWEGRTRLIVVTNGDAPIRYFTRRGSGTVPAFAVEAVDTTAAGDAFMGALLHRIAQVPGARGELDTDPAALEPTLRFAAACGALSVTRYGAFTAMPLGDEVERFLRAHP